MITNLYWLVLNLKTNPFSDYYNLYKKYIHSRVNQMAHEEWSRSFSVLEMNYNVYSIQRAVYRLIKKKTKFTALGTSSGNMPWQVVTEND